MVKGRTKIDDREGCDEVVLRGLSICPGIVGPGVLPFDVYSVCVITVNKSTVSYIRTDFVGFGQLAIFLCVKKYRSRKVISP